MVTVLDTQSGTNQTFQLLPRDHLFESGTNPRRSFDKGAMQELVASVREFGILQPILVRQVAEVEAQGVRIAAHFEIVAGARRFRAAKDAGLATVPCFVRQLTDKQVLEIQFVENLQRQDLHPLDEGLGYKTLHEEHGYSVDDLAGKVGKSKGYVYGRMLLAKLPVKVQTLFFDGDIDLSHAQLVARIPDPELAEEAAVLIAKGDTHYGKPLPYRRAADMVRRDFQCELKQAPFPTNDANLLAGVGACGPCPKRTGNQKDLFNGPDEKGRADVCTDPTCFQQKVRAEFARKKTEIIEQGGKVLEGKKAEAVRYSSDLVELDATCLADQKGRKWSQLIKGQDVPPVLVQGRDGEARLYVERAAAEKAAKVAGHKFAARSASTGYVKSSEDKKREQDHRIRVKTLERILPDLVERAEGADAATAWSLVLAFGLTRTEGRKKAAKRRGIDLDHAGAMAGDPLEEHGMTAKQLQGLALEITAMEYASSSFGGWGAAIRGIALGLGFDLKKAEAVTRKEIEKATPKTAKKQPAKKGKAKAPPVEEEFEECLEPSEEDAEPATPAPEKKKAGKPRATSRKAKGA